MRKIMITAALTGGGHGKEANPNLPEQPEEIIKQALECREAGAAIVHLHARDRQGKSTTDINIIRKIYEGIRSRSDVIIELSTGGGPSSPMSERIAPFSLRPELATLNNFLIVLNPGGKEQPVIYSRSEIESSARHALEMKVKPSVAVINFNCIEEAENLISKRLLRKPYYFSMGLGMPAQGASKATAQNLISLVERLPQDAIFTMSAHGEEQIALTILGLLLGGHVRVGLEDSVDYAPGRLARSNAELVARAARIIKELNMEVATPEAAREILKLGV